MWVQRSGYHPPQENIASHSRRRYRLVPSKVPPNAPQPDPSLWIVHYARAAQNDIIPAQRIPITPQVQATLAQRRYLQTQGQLVRKEFMLHDRNNWPTINFPAQMGAQGFAQPQAYYANAGAGRQQPPGAYYPPQQPGVPAGQAPVKAPRGHRTSTGTAAAAAADFAMEDEDVSTGDLLDMLTPREISKIRYQQHHEWMEEIFASPYTIKQITPVDLGIGRKGELESLTDGLFDAPVSAAHPKDGKDNTTALQGKLEPEKAEEFADRVAKKVSDMTAEIEKLKRRHERRMAKISRMTVLKEAELRLREAGANPSETGPEIWRLEGRIDTSNEEEAPVEETVEDISLRIPRYRVDDVVKDLEKTYGRTIIPATSIACIEKGGLLERIEPTPQPEDNTGADTDMLMETSILDQFVASSTSTPGQVSQQATAVSATQPASEATGDGDVEMGGATNVSVQSGTAAGETGEWVVVENETAGNISVPTDKPTADNAPIGGETVETSNFDDAATFTNMDSAGDALAAYDDQHDGLDLPDLENSAFGDAFHASDHEMGHHHEDDEMS